jgi:N-acetylmuramoyl-L-alanine amidase
VIILLRRRFQFRNARRRRTSKPLAGVAVVLALLAAGCSAAMATLPSGPSLAPSSPYAEGACKRFDPTHGNLHRTIFVDAGHGGPDPGTSGPDGKGGVIAEKTATLAVALDLLPILRAQGYTVVLSRTGDSSVMRLGPGDLDGRVFTPDAEHRETLARVTCANDQKAGLLLSIHFNGFEDPTVGGTETFYDDARPFAGENQRVASLVQQDVQAALLAAGWQIPDRGITLDSSDDAPTLTAQAAAYPYLLLLGPAQVDWLTQPSQMPGVLSEPLFLSDPIEGAIAAGPSGQQAIAQGFAQAIAEAYTPPTSTPSP